MLPVLVAVGVIFGLIGGAMAFTITYAEYQRHQFTGRRLVGEALRAGIAAFLLLLALTIAAGFIVGRFQR
jgi:hypothetical protein